MGKRKRQLYPTSGATALRPVAAVGTIPAPGQGKVKLDQEYISPLASNPLTNTLASDRREAQAPEITFATYRRMMNDSAVSSAVKTLVWMTLADGLQLNPAFEAQQIGDDAKEFKQANDQAEFVRRALLGLNKPLETTLGKLLQGALTYGHKVAEKTFKYGGGMDSGKLILGRIALKSYEALDFCVDEFWNHVGFVQRGYGRAPLGVRILPREKFAVLTLFEEDEDPRGNSALRPAYTPWLFKTHTWPEFLRWLQNCAMNAVIGKTPPKDAASFTRAPVANETQKTPTQALLDALLGLKSAGVAVIPNGAETDTIPSSDTDGFETGFSIADSQIAKAILGQTLATGEAQFGTRAQSQTHLQVLDLFVAWLKRELAAMVTADIINPLIKYNFGEEALAYAPLVTFGDSDRRDWSKDANAAALLHGKITKTQWLAICTQLGLPAPDEGEEVPGYDGQMAQEQPPIEQEQKPPQQARVLPFGTRTRSNAAFVTVRRAA
jgi:hypothetical protein